MMDMTIQWHVCRVRIVPKTFHPLHVPIQKIIPQTCTMILTGKGDCQDKEIFLSLSGLMWVDVEWSRQHQLYFRFVPKKRKKKENTWISGMHN